MLKSPDFTERLNLFKKHEIRFEPHNGIGLSLIEGKLVVTPAAKAKYSLEQLVENITRENAHAEIDTGEPVGNEVW